VDLIAANISSAEHVAGIRGF